MEKDRVFAEKQDRIKPFAFSREVARVFDDMLVRSVPLYEESIKRQAQLALRFFQKGCRIYDLGCSHGNLGLGILREFRDRPVSLIGVDTSWPMLEKYRKRLKAVGAEDRVDLVCGGMEHIRLENAAVVIINLTLQFLDMARREHLMERIYDGLIPGGVLLLTEKTAHDAEPVDALYLDMYTRFKRENGYSDLEISQKRDALENVLVPEPIAVHQDRLARAGFRNFDVWLKWFNFVAMIAVK